MKTIFALSLLALTLNSFAGTKAKLNCVFKKSKATDLLSMKLTVDLEKQTAVADVDWGADNEVSKLSVLSFSRASDAKDKEILTEFKEFEKSPDHYLAPNTLVIAGNNGDDTDQTLVIQFRTRAESKKELMANRAKGEADYMDVNLTYIQSVDGSSRTDQTTCTMEVN